MAIKHLMEMTKADRYTADGCEALNKAREADVEDRTYKTGEISEKTGLQKQPDGSWAPPKKGGTSGAKAGEGTLKPSRKPDQKKNPLIKNPDVLGMTANGARKRMEAFGAQFVENKNGKDYFKTTSGDLVEVEYGDNKKVLSSTTYTGGEKPEQAYPTTAGHNIESYINKLHEEGWKNDGWERNSANGALGYFKKGDKTIRVMQNWNGTLGGVTEIKPKAENKPAESKPATRKSVDKEKLLDALSFDLVDTTADIEEEYNAIEHSDNSRLPEFVRQEIERDYVNKTNGEKWTDEEKDIIAEEVTRRIKQRQSKDSAPRELTGDCKIKIRQTQDVKYKTGDISQKTGLQKQPDGSWKPPRNGSKTPAGSAEEKPTAGSKAKQTPEANWKEASVDLKNQAGVGFFLNTVAFEMTPVWAKKHGYSPDDVNGSAAQNKLVKQIITSQDWNNPEEAVKKINSLDFGYNNWKVTEKQADKVKIATRDGMGNLREITIKRPQPAPEPKPAEEKKSQPERKSMNQIMLEKNGFTRVENSEGAMSNMPRYQYKSLSGKTYNVWRGPTDGVNGFVYYVQTPGGFPKKMKDVKEIKRYLDSDGGNWGIDPNRFARGELIPGSIFKEAKKKVLENASPEKRAEYSDDAAPRVLTGDTRIRVRK